MLKNILLGIIFTGLSASLGYAQTHYHHNVFWGRIALTDTINAKFRWEVYLQTRQQNISPGSLNVFKAPQFVSYWPWFTYSPNPSLRIGISPIGYFKHWALIGNPADLERKPVTELRTTVRLEQEQRFRKFIYANRYSLEHRWRDLANNHVFQPNWRARYQVRLEFPITAKWLHRPFSLVAWDEISVQFGKAVKKNPNVFDQNRLYGGFNYGLTDNIRLSIGYFYQIQERSSGKEFDHANVLFCILTLDNLFSQFRKKAKP
ncbi:DUF2490 domain-containing protein [Rhodocytophaga rosea]|uniref:DUF2490 domain-containing protein n=1 Tax=Rhodocytophaga rosea TaxID=2704465 RepID=A0A6C0GMP9_9BACT|nr:DUF2490 domain-containing protein [Rhodocytophaga rosea]QHT68910.1 DUF2490 domain-containing protein [Rhodocytophaga rosea]